jgi:Fe-S cluster assembly iron-binding protein IscA
MLKIETNQETLAEIAKVLESQNEGAKSVRVFVAGYGCGGPSLGLALDELKEADVSELQGDIRFVMDRELFENLGDIKIEHVDGGYLVAPVVQDDTEGGSGCSSCSGCGH